MVSDECRGIWRNFSEAYPKGPFAARVRIKYLHNFGAVMSPANAYLQQSGWETLPQCCRQAGETALEVARHLETVPHVEPVYYSGLDSNQDKGLADKYLSNGVGPVLSFRLEAPKDLIADLDRTIVGAY